MQNNRLSISPVFAFPANGCNSLNLARSFGQMGIPVYVFGGSKPPSDHIYSRYVHYVKSPQPDIGSSKFGHFLTKYAQTLVRRPVLFPTNDLAVMYVCLHKNLLKSSMHLPYGSSSSVATILDKAKFNEALCQRNIPRPLTIMPSSLKEAIKAGEEIGYPCILKPALSIEFSRIFLAKCLYLSNKKEMMAFWPKIQTINTNWLVQEIIPGDRIAGWTGYYDQKYRLKAYSPYIKERQYPTDFGVGTFFRTQKNGLLIRWGDEIIRHIEYCGLVDVEFKHDPRDDSWKIIEINPRTCMHNSLASVANLNLEYIAYLDTLGKNVPLAACAKMGIGWTHVSKDFASALKNHGMSFRKWLASIKGPKTHAYFSWKDPLPAITRLPDDISAIMGTILNRLHHTKT